MEWRLGDLTLDLAQPVGAGIVNVTVDSMFEGARSGTPEQAIADGIGLARAGFDMLDGGEVARQARDAGACCVNDISGGCEEMFELVAARGCGYVLMHIEGPPRVDRPWRGYGDGGGYMWGWFEERVERMRELGVGEDQIAIDPGLDFDLSPEQDLEIIRRLGELKALGPALYVSLSRKDFLGAVLAGSWEERLPPREGGWGPVAATTLAVRAGADILRLHDRSSLQAMRLAGAVRGTGPSAVPY